MIILLLLVLGIAWWLYSLFRRGKLTRFQFGMIVMMLVGISLLLAGPRGALTGLLFAIVPILRRGLSLAMWAQSVRQLSGLFGRQAPAGQTPTMTVEEARGILGLGASPSKQDVIEAHRKLIAKVHPDKGGTTVLAARLNQARDCLLENMST